MFLNACFGLELKLNKISVVISSTHFAHKQPCPRPLQIRSATGSLIGSGTPCSCRHLENLFLACASIMLLLAFEVRNNSYFTRILYTYVTSQRLKIIHNEKLVTLNYNHKTYNNDNEKTIWV